MPERQRSNRRKAQMVVALWRILRAFGQCWSRARRVRREWITTVAKDGPHERARNYLEAIPVRSRVR